MNVEWAKLKASELRDLAAREAIVVLPLCLAASPGGELSLDALPVAIAAVGVHGLAMLTVTGVIAVVVYRWVGVDFLRRGWINLDLLWSIALVATGLLLFVT
jgi:hypothetical protein